MAKSFGLCGIFSTDDAAADQRQIDAENFVEEDDFYDDLDYDVCGDCGFSPCVCVDGEHCCFCGSSPCCCRDLDEEDSPCSICCTEPCLCSGIEEGN